MITYTPAIPGRIVYPWTIVYPDGFVEDNSASWYPLQAMPYRDNTRRGPR